MLHISRIFLLVLDLGTLICEMTTSASFEGSSIDAMVPTISNMDLLGQFSRRVSKDSLNASHQGLRCERPLLNVILIFEFPRLDEESIRHSSQGRYSLIALPFSSPRPKL